MWNPWRDSPLYRRDLNAWRRAHERPRGLVVLVGIFSLLVGIITLRWRLPPSATAWYGARPPDVWIGPLTHALALVPAVFAALITAMMGLVEVYWGREGDLDELYLSRLGGEEIIGAKTAAIVAPFVVVFALVGVGRVIDAVGLALFGEQQPALVAVAWTVEAVGRTALLVLVAMLTAALAWVRAIAQPNPWRALWEVMAAGGALSLAAEAASWGLPAATVAAVEWVGLQERIERGRGEDVARMVVWLGAPAVCAALIRPTIRWAGRRFDRDYRELT